MTVICVLYSSQLCIIYQTFVTLPVDYSVSLSCWLCIFIQSAVWYEAIGCVFSILGQQFTI